VFGEQLNHIRSCKKQSERPKPLRVAVGSRPKQQFPGPLKFGIIFRHYFNAMCAPQKLSEYSVGVCGGLLYLLDSCMKQLTCLKSLRISVGWPGPKQQVPAVQNGRELFGINIGTAWISMQCAHLWNLPNTPSECVGTSFTICTAARSNQICQSLWKIAADWPGTPSVFPLPLQIWGIFCYSMNVWVQHCKAICTP
jgi:hypothetical protein